MTGGMQWETDLIGYNAEKSYGSPAYWAQVMFGSYTGDHTVASKVEGAGEKFFYSATRNEAKKQIYLKLVNGSTDAQELEIHLEGVKAKAVGKVVTLAGRTTQATNSINDPDRVKPAETELKGVGASFHHSMPGLSIEVVCLEVQ